MNIGFTGTQSGMTQYQKNRLAALLTELSPRLEPPDDSHGSAQFHHGDCIGADAEAAAIAKFLGYWIVAWPPINIAKRAFFASDEERIPGPYLERNRSIVNAVSRLLAAPKENEETLRSGTWATIRYARKINIPVEIIWPRRFPNHQQ